MKIIFFGTSEFAVPALKALREAGYDIATVITVPDQPSGRKRVMTAPPAKLAALELGLSVLQPESLKDEEFFNTFKTIDPDICIVAAYGKLIPQRYLDLPKHGFLNIHPSLLPKYRGPTPVQTAILNGDTETGITIMKVDKDMDHGGIVSSEQCIVSSEVTYQELHNLLADIGAKLLIDTIPKYVSGEIKPQEQDHGQATFTKIFDRKDGQIDWSRPGEQIYNQIRALNPEPGTWATFNNKILNIKSAQIGLGQSGPGLVSLVDNNVVVGTGTCDLILKKIQLEGRNTTDAQSFASGHPEFLNSILQ